MSKRVTPLGGPEIMLDQEAAVPLYRQLYDRLRGSILAGQLEAGTRLPSTRVLASELGVSRTTTALAYELLLLEGYIESKVGDGTRVAHLNKGASSMREIPPVTPTNFLSRSQEEIRDVQNRRFRHQIA